MKKMKFSTSVPALIDSVSPVVSGAHTTMAKLKVFYKGITGDGRRFTDSFAEKLLQNLPETPVVALYDEETEDFIGHAEEQGVFGYVPENAALYFEVIDGQEWAVTDVKLFTQREDVGRIAKKIVGKQHSLELNPHTVEFEVNEDEDNNDYFVSFTDGELIGLSVLGDWQTPAFTGSGFFSQNNNTPISLDDIITKYLSLPKEIEVTQNGGKIMFLDFAKGLFKDLEIESVLENDHFLIYRVGDKTYIALRDGEELTNVDITSVFLPTQEDQVEEDEKDVEESEAEVEEKDEQEAEPIEEPQEEEQEELDESVEPETQEQSEGEDEIVEQEQQEERVEPEAPETPANTAALNEAEREELENYRRKDKEGLIAEYSEYLSEEKIKEFKNSVDKYTREELEKDLSFAAMQQIKANEESKPTQDTFARSIIEKSESKVVNGMDVLVKHFLNENKRGEN